MHFAIDREQERDRVLRDRVRRIVDDANHLDAELRGGREIDVVEAGAAQRHETRAAFVQRFEHFGIRRIVDEDADRAVARRELDGVHVERHVVVPELVVFLLVRLVDVLTLVRGRTIDRHFHDALLENCIDGPVKSLTRGQRYGDLHE